MRHGDHSCKEVQDKIELLIDGELDRHSAAYVMDIIEACPFCQADYNKQLQLRKMLNVSLQRKSCGEQLKSSIVSKIRGLQ